MKSLHHPAGKRSIALVAVAALATFGLVGCAAEATPEPTEPAPPASTTSEFFDMLPADIQSAGVLRIGVSANFPPGNFEGDDGKLDGSEIQLGKALGELIGIEIEHVTTNFAGLLSGLQADRFDVVLSGMSDTLEREKEATFVNYLNVGANFLVQAGNPKKINVPADLCGLTGAAPIGTTYIDQVEKISQDECIANGKPAIEMQTFQSGLDVTQAVITGRADFSFASKMANLYFASQSNGQLAAVGETVNPQLTGFVVPIDNAELVGALQAALQELVDSGRMTELMKPWGLDGETLDTISINGATK